MIDLEVLSDRLTKKKPYAYVNSKKMTAVTKRPLPHKVRWIVDLSQVYTLEKDKGFQNATCRLILFHCLLMFDTTCFSCHFNAKSRLFYFRNAAGICLNTWKLKISKVYWIKVTKNSVLRNYLVNWNGERKQASLKRGSRRRILKAAS